MSAPPSRSVSRSPVRSRTPVRSRSPVRRSPTPVREPEPQDDDQDHYKVFCGNFEYDMTLKELDTLFEKYGEVARVDMKQGFCFAYYKHKSDGQACIDDCDGMEFGSRRRPLKLEWAKGDGRVKMREDQRRKAVAPNTTLFVVNFDPLETDERDMRDYFGKFGDLDRVQIKKNFAFIQFKELSDATAALEACNNAQFKDRVLTVEYVATSAEQRARDPPNEPYDRDRGGGYREPPRGRYDDRRMDDRRYDDRRPRYDDRLRGPPLRDERYDRGGDRYGGGGGGYDRGGGGGGYDRGYDRGADRYAGGGGGGYRPRSRSPAYRPRRRSPSPYRRPARRSPSPPRRRRSRSYSR